jgi:hypothetical protein
MLVVEDSDPERQALLAEARHWWLRLLWGVLFLVLGFVIFGYDADSLTVLSIFIGVSFLLSSNALPMLRVPSRAVDDGARMTIPSRRSRSSSTRSESSFSRRVVSTSAASAFRSPPWLLTASCRACSNSRRASW